MEWLRKLLGDEAYKKLEENGAIEILKSSMGEKEWIENDPLKTIPKHEFNKINEEKKLLKQKNEAYEAQLKERNNLITDEEMKKELSKQEALFKTQLSEQKKEFEKQTALMDKKNAMIALLGEEGVQGVELFVDRINYDEVIVDNGKVLNPEKIINPIKEKYPQNFQKQLTGKPPIKGDDTKPKATIEQLIDLYEKTNPSNLVVRQNLRKQIFELRQEEGTNT